VKTALALLFAAGCIDAAVAQNADSGPEHAADAIFGAEAMARSRDVLLRENGHFRAAMVLADELEWTRENGANAYRWDLQGWYGGDHDKLWLKSTGEDGAGATTRTAELQALWSHAVLPFFDLQAGLRHDFRPGPSRSYAVLGLQGLVPYEFELDAALFLSERGDLGARVEFSHDLRLTQRLILQPELEAELSAQDVPELGIGSGLGSAAFGLRLRYEFAREFAPYLGLHYERRFGATRNYAEAASAHTGDEWQFLAGLRAWF